MDISRHKNPQKGNFNYIQRNVLSKKPSDYVQAHKTQVDFQTKIAKELLRKKERIHK